MVTFYKHMRLIMMVGCIIAYSCYLSSQEPIPQQEESENKEQLMQEEELLEETRNLYYAAQPYAHMLHLGAIPKEIEDLIAQRYKEKPEIGRKIWEKAQELAAKIPSEGSVAFAPREKKNNES